MSTMPSSHPAPADAAVTADAARPRLISDRQTLRRYLASLRQVGKTIGLVPTMGALHEGHLSLVDAARAECDSTVVTIFVNPTQFGPSEDLAAYPRNLEEDLELLGQRGVDLVFAPSEGEIYRPGHETFVEVGATGEPLEGEFRPGHFRGVATIVLKLLNLVPATVAFFGSKDYQQALVVRRLVEDFDLPVEIRTCPIVRERDGLAMSSRNVHLNAEERRRALAMPQSLGLAAALVAEGERDAAVIRQRVAAHIRAVAGVAPQYVALVRAGTVTPVAQIDGPSVVAVAVVIGTTRLIDNRVVG
jgi:pantoate--beta-alanine ligase